MESNLFNIVVVDLGGKKLWSYNGLFIPNTGDIIFRKVDNSNEPMEGKYKVWLRIINTVEPERIEVMVSPYF